MDRRCKTCEATRKRDQRLRKDYGITEHTYKMMRKAQDSKCDICGVVEQNLVIDHDHGTGKVRSLLCNSCNAGLGWIEKESFLEAALGYLRKHA